MEIVTRTVDTLHRLAESRKMVLQGLSIAAAFVTESLPYVVDFLKLFGADPAKQARLEATCHAFAAGMVLLAAWVNKLTTMEDVALKTWATPPGAPTTEVQNNTVNVSAAPAVPAAAPTRTAIPGAAAPSARPPTTPSNLG